MATKLTNRNIEGIRREALRKLLASPTSKEVIVWDEELTGLGLRLGRSGKASWLVYRRIGQGGTKAKQVFSVFGTLGEIPDPNDAREKARTILEDIRNGIDPNAKKREQRASDIEAFHNGKLSNLISLWLEKNPKQGAYGEEVDRMIKVDILQSLGDTKLVRDITRKDIIKLMDGLPRGTGRSVFYILSPFLKWCVEREVMAKSPMENLTAPEPFDARDRVLTDDELVLVWSAASSLPYPWGPFYKLLILTLQRRDEVACLPWSELDLSKKREWIIPGKRTKNGKEHLVHLSGWAVGILHTCADKGTELVFTTATKKGVEVPISGFSKAKKLLDRKVRELNKGKDIPPWRVHDLRRTAATGMGALKVPPHIVERILNHTSGVNAGIVSVYQRFEYPEERKEALATWANHINDLLLDDMRREPDQSNVVAFH